jgi:hypothetical protein
MTTKQLIHEQIEAARDEDLDELYRLVQTFVQSKADTAGTPGIMAKLRQIKIQAPADFSANLDQYATGEKRVENDLH